MGDVEAFEAALEAAIDSTMQTEVLKGAKKAIQESVQSNVYAAYTPKFMSRRGPGGGIGAEGSLEHTYGGYTLTITDEAPWQQLYGGRTPGGMLADAISTGDYRYNMWKAGSRPFMQKAEEEYGSSKFESDLAAGLRARGFVVG